MKRELICISCPLGCRITVTEEKGNYTVTGNTCKRGEQYALSEVTAPMRTVTTTVRVAGGEIARVSVKTAQPIPKSEIFNALNVLKGVELAAPVHIGDVVVKDILGLGADIVATKAVEAGD